MARVAPTTSVQAGLADRMKKKEPQTASAGANTGASKPNYSSRFQNPGAGSNMSRTVDRSRFQNRQPPATRRVDPSTVTRSGGFRGAGATATPGGYARPAPITPIPMAPAQGGAGPVPGPYQTPGRPQVQPQPQVAQPYYPQAVRPQPAVAQPYYPTPAPTTPAGPRWPGDTTWWRPQPQYQPQAQPAPTPYNPTPYNTYRR